MCIRDSSFPLVVLMTSTQWSSFNAPSGSCVDNVCQVGSDDRLKVASTAYEGYRICIETASTGWGNRNNDTIFVIGNDDRGYLFGVGRLLREMRMGIAETYTTNLTRTHTIESNFSICTSPAFPMRGHYIGYNQLTDCFDGWTVAMMDQYIRDLAVFGCNQVEMIAAPVGGDPHFTLQPFDMLVAMSQILDNYGMNVSLQVNQVSALNFEEAFSAMPRLDGIFIASGDPGDITPPELLQYAQSMVNLLHKYHPGAEVWISSQTYNQTEMEQFYQLVPTAMEWLTGVVYGPHTRVDIQSFRNSLPLNIPIRHYPDLCHQISAQFPAPNWDYAFGFTEAREPIVVRAAQYQQIALLTMNGTIGFGAYSEGVTDDIHKSLWSAIYYDPSISLDEVVGQYARYFIGQALETQLVTAILGLEKDWTGPLINNTEVAVTYEAFEMIIKQSPNRGAQLLKNWRFLAYWFRSMFDTFLQEKLQFETALQAKAEQILLSADTVGPITAINQALEVLNTSLPESLITLRESIFEMGYQLYQTANLELSVEPPFLSISLGRGDVLDTIDNPLTDAPWYTMQLNSIATNSSLSPQQQIDAINSLVNRTNPGEHGFYDDLGNLLSQPHLVLGQGYQTDPSFYNSSDVSLWEPFNSSAVTIYPIAWYTFAQSYYDAPFQLYYDKLNPSVQYVIKLVYYTTGPSSFLVQLNANGYPVHGYIEKPWPMTLLTFQVPPAATAGGSVLFTFSGVPGGGGNGRGVQVAEAFLMPA
eukprot:TRINITY_DN9343_c0_g2_i1.p1 TRINITY_DN9343_c0_g2~~TRINITY_DN9343_c0_g2_i1.p1  ORF type:complete len:756 (-),score=172.09 TRINITY_DN9343_c0_g2_i1:38-2305(-)